MKLKNVKKNLFYMFYLFYRRHAGQPGCRWRRWSRQVSWCWVGFKAR